MSDSASSTGLLKKLTVFSIRVTVFYVIIIISFIIKS